MRQPASTLFRFVNGSCTVVLMALGLALSVSPASAADEESGFKPIFNGKDLTGWDGNPKIWSVRDGAITGQTTAENPTKGNTFLIWRGGKPSNFELRMSFRMVGGNSGIQYRSKDLGNWVAGGYQADMDAGMGYTGALYEERARGMLAERGQVVRIGANGEKQVVKSLGKAAELATGIKKEDWNDYVIIARGNHLTQKINGRVMCEVIDEEAAKRAESGIIALQVHAGPPMLIQFKNVRLKTFAAEGPKAAQETKTKKIVLVAGRPSHGPGDHEHNAGMLLFKKCLDKLPGLEVTVCQNGWPTDPQVFDNADAVALFMDGGAGHPMIQGDGLAQIGKLMKKGVGLVCLHYAVEIPNEKGGRELLDWIGGYYERDFSINPMWTAEFKSIPEHPITRGVKPFTLLDEWYYNMHFRPEMSGVQTILKAIPPDNTRGTAAAKAHPGREEIVAWAVERPDGGRGFGFTGGHFHKGWGNNDIRTLVLNALCWTAHYDVPAGGVPSEVTPEDLKQNLDRK
ncbi:MAG: family 16 glycoside hydrolase [Pirellulales bacterium]